MGYIVWILMWLAVIWLVAAFVSYDIYWMSELSNVANWTGDERFGLLFCTFVIWLALTALYRDFTRYR